MSNAFMDSDDANALLWARLLEVELAEEEDDDPELDDDVLRQAQANVFERLGISPGWPEASLVATFVADLEQWIASAPEQVLARDVGSIVSTLEIAVSELADAGFAGVVEVECDLDEQGRICDVAVLIPDVPSDRALTLVLETGDGQRFVTQVSRFGLARFDDLTIAPADANSLRFELRER